MNVIQVNGSSLPKSSLPLIEGIDYVEFYVGNVLQATHFYRTGFGFTPIAYTNSETGALNCTSWVLNQNDIYLVLTSSLDQDNEIARYVAKHGDGVHNIAFRVNNTVQVFETLLQRGATPIMEPRLEEDDNGEIIRAAVRGVGDTIHSLIQRQNYQGVFAPHYQKIENPPPSLSIGVSEIDHITICVNKGELEGYCQLYREIFDFHESYKMDFVNDGSGMNARVIENSTGTVKLTICEPIVSQHKSQIDEYITHHGGSGVQHLAFLTDNIIEAVRSLLSNGVQTVNIPHAYYKTLLERVGPIKEDVETLHKLQILADRDKHGYLFQVFTKMVQDRPTFFLEVIERCGTTSFGQGNVKALFQAVRAEQEKRENF